MVRKKIDNRIRVLIENGVALGHRTMFLVVGDKSRDQVKYTISSHFQRILFKSTYTLFTGGHLTSYAVQSNRESSSISFVVL